MTQNKPVLINENIQVDCPATSSQEAILSVGKLLADSGYVSEKYIDGMIRRDASLSVYIGNMLAIPHGEYSDKNEIHESGIAVMTYPEGIDWHGETVKVVIGIAGLGEDHMKILMKCAVVFESVDEVERIVNAKDAELIYDLLNEEA